MINLMAFAKAREVKEAIPFSKYLGATTAHLVAINPTKEEISKITGRDMQDPVYLSEVDIVDVKGNKKKGKQNAITFWFSIQNPSPKDENDTVIYINHRIYFSASARIGSNSGKIQIVDEYGRFAWATEKEYENNVIPQYSSGQANISSKYRAAMVGEEDLITAMKAFLGLSVPVERLADGTMSSLTEDEIKNRSDEFACGLEPEDIKQIVNGNVSVIKTALDDCNDVKLILGVKHGYNGDYQAVYHTIYKKSFNNLAKVEKEIKESNSQTTEYLVEDHIPNGLIEYVVNPTSMSKSKGSEDIVVDDNDDMPF